MSESYLGTFALSEAPFTKEIADADLWLPSSKAGVVDELCEAVSEHASVLLWRSRRRQDLCPPRVAQASAGSGLPAHLLPQCHARAA
jgi:hypothetical protein